MSSAPIQRDLTTKTQSAVRRGAPSGQVGARKVTAPDASTVGGGGQKECFTIPDFVPGTHNIGYDHWICDPNGTFDET